MSDKDRLALNVTVRENTRKGRFSDLESVFVEMFSTDYDDVDITVSAEGDNE